MCGTLEFPFYKLAFLLKKASVARFVIDRRVCSPNKRCRRHVSFSFLLFPSGCLLASVRRAQAGACFPLSLFLCLSLGPVPPGLGHGKEGLLDVKGHHEAHELGPGLVRRCHLQLVRTLKRGREGEGEGRGSDGARGGGVVD